MLSIDVSLKAFSTKLNGHKRQEPNVVHGCYEIDTFLNLGWRELWVSAVVVRNKRTGSQPSAGVSGGGNW